MAMIRQNIVSEGVKRTCKEFCLCFFVPAIMICGAALIHYLSLIKTENGPVEVREQLGVTLGTMAIEGALQGIAADLVSLAQRVEHDESFGSDSQGMVDALGPEFRIFAGHRPISDQLRLLDSTGAQVFSVSFDSGLPVIVSAGEREKQNKPEVFAAAWALDPGQVYLSQLDVVNDFGPVATLGQSVLHFATPLYGANGDKRGVLVLNYQGAELARQFETAVSNIAEHIMLIDADGLWLRAPDTGHTRSMIAGGNGTFHDAYPGVWPDIRAADTGQIYASDGLFSFSTVYPLHSGNGERAPAGTSALANAGNPYYWKIVSFVANDNLGAMARFRHDVPLFLVIFAVLVMVSTMLTSARLRNKKITAQIDFERRFRETLENIGLLALGVDSEGHITFCNESLLDLSGWRRDELIGKDWLERLVPPTLRKQYAREFQRRVATANTAETYVAEIQTCDGDRRVISWNDAVLSDDDGKLIGAIQIGEDITESRRARETLRKLSSAVEQSPSVVMIVDLQGRIEYVNPKFTESTGYTLAEVLGQNPHILKSGETSSDEYTDLWSTISAGDEWRGVFHNQKKNGDLFWESASISPIRDSKGSITHFLAVKEDISERIRLEGEVDARNREIAKNRELAVMGRMASMIAHDLRNPLSSIKMGLQIIGDKEARIWCGDEGELIKIALGQVGYMEEILEDLLSFSRPDALNPEWVSIGKILDQTIISCHKQIEEYGAQLETWYQPGLPTLHADPRKLRQVFCNILMNALQATEGITDRRPEIAVTVQAEIGAERPQIRVEFCDNGHGIESDQSDKFCEPFFTTRAKGTGLGLAIVKRIVVQHSGSVFLSSRKGAGARVSVVLPNGPINDIDSQDCGAAVSEERSSVPKATAA